LRPTRFSKICTAHPAIDKEDRIDCWPRKAFRRKQYLHRSICLNQNSWELKELNQQGSEACRFDFPTLLRAATFGLSRAALNLPLTNLTDSLTSPQLLYEVFANRDRSGDLIQNIKGYWAWQHISLFFSSAYFSRVPRCTLSNRWQRGSAGFN
jgi:hypothetical protein